MNVILKELKKISSLLIQQKKVITLDEFCSYTGISKAYAYKLTSSAKIKFYRPLGKMIYFDLEEVNEFLKQNPVIEKEGIRKKASNHFLKSNLMLWK